jgi:transcriptional regulator with XRE-family HTH domain
MEVQGSENMGRLRELREEAVLTVRELSALSGVSEDTITKIENGHRKARPSTVRKLAKALDVEPQELVAPKDVVVSMAPAEIKSEAPPAKITVKVSVGQYWRILEALKGNIELGPDELRQAEEAFERSLVG